ncbi:MAG: HpcH/HpaI aldolase family protein [Devosia sp.]
MISPNPLKAALARGEKQIGCWLGLGSPIATEIVASAGFDWVLVDMEHTSLSESETVGLLRAVRSVSTIEPLVRVPWNDMVTMKRLLDSGVRSILVPYVQNADEARRAAAATRYPPAGVRGFAGMHRGNDYGRDTNYVHRIADEIFLAVQAESPEAIRNAGAIAAVDGIDCVFVGPNDLAANMGLLGQPRHPDVLAAIASIVEPVKAAGKTAGMLDYNIENSRAWLEAGFDFVAVGSDTALLAAGAANLVKAYRQPG